MVFGELSVFLLNVLKCYFVNILTDFEDKLRMMGFDVNGVDTASIDLDVIEETTKEAKMPLEKTGRKAIKPPGKSTCEVVKPPGKTICEVVKSPGKTSCEVVKPPGKTSCEVVKSPGKSSCEKNPESVGKAALTTPKVSNAGRSIYNLVKKSAGGISSTATSAPPAVDTPKQFEPLRVRHRSAEYESGTEDSFDESVEFRKPGPVDAKKPGPGQFGRPGPVGADTRKPCVVTFSSTVQELTMSEQSESLDSGSQLRFFSLHPI